MDLVLCHTTADFDTLGAAVGVALLYPAARIVLAGGCHPTVQAFLALHRDEYPLIERRAVDLDAVEAIAVVDTQSLERLGPVGSWVTRVAERGGEVQVYDHHSGGDRTLPATELIVDEVGAATTLVVEALQARGLQLNTSQATVMALGIHVDTGSLTFTSSTVRDAAALAWVMGQGASQSAIAEFVEPNLSPTLQDLSETAITQLQREQQPGHTLGWVLLKTATHVPGLSGLAERLLTFLDLDSLLFGAWFPSRETTQKLVLIGRTRGRVAATPEHPGIDFNVLLSRLGGGGHPTAAAATYITDDAQGEFERTLAELRQQIPPMPTARDLMSSPVRTIRPSTQITEAQRILLRYGHSGLSVVDRNGELVGVISRRDIDLALHHGFGHAPVKGYMSTQIKTVQPHTPLPDIEALMVTYDIGRLPVLEGDRLVGVVTRTDVLRQLHQSQQAQVTVAEPVTAMVRPPSPSQLWQTLQARLAPALWEMLQSMAAVARDRGWQLYLVGGGVRDLFLSEPDTLLDLPDVDLVVDSAYQTLEMGAGVVLAEAIKAQHPDAELQVYGRFQTAALVWHTSPMGGDGSLMVDIATARTEFYPYPAANPEVEASSIRQDLYRRDFTINALAVSLTPPQPGQLLDFFGGLVDLQARHIRVLHANSFIEDPTRIYRAVRFAVRLGFTLEPQTEGFIRHAIDSGVYKRLQTEIAKLPTLQTRLKTELQYILAADYWEAALSLLDDLGALVCLHPELALSDRLWQQLRRLSRWLAQVDLLAALSPWQLRLELLLTGIPTRDRESVATHLQLPQTSVQRLAQLASAEVAILEKLPQCDRPSQCRQLLDAYDLESLVLISLRHPRHTSDRIWRYLTHWSQVKAPINGQDLKRLGYPPGPAYRDMLLRALYATLDGELANQAAAIAFIQRQYPLENATSNIQRSS
ncbi:CBS domain-containing protein [Leptolyngbya iicbica]|uniref:CBS domain-containing protein n=2 Tax=Cyanophyceae TaxID=3028117 RepID=A0A4V2E2J3_9CYAN|nr:CBS domain-containing protein [Leptolyngbya sp. LK]RZM78756.1 CBS domain-containing protein [Leptolyngbya sp. LK]